MQEDRVEMPPEEANRLVTTHVCAICWQNLLAFFNSRTRTSRIECSNVNCTGGGYVTRGYADKRRAESAAEKNEAQRNLGQALGIKRKSVSELLNELGIKE